jgi:hypothetical protein
VLSSDSHFQSDHSKLLALYLLNKNNSHLDVLSCFVTTSCLSDLAKELLLLLLLLLLLSRLVLLLSVLLCRLMSVSQVITLWWLESLLLKGFPHESSWVLGLKQSGHIHGKPFNWLSSSKILFFLNRNYFSNYVLVIGYLLTKYSYF